MSEPVSEPEQPGGEQRAGEQSPVERPGSAKAEPESLTFRILPIALLAVLAVAVCVSPVAFTHPAGLVLFLIPLGLGFWVVRTKTVVTPEKITARMLRRVEIDWDDVRQLRVGERRWLRAVLGSGREVLLPATRLRDLPRIAAMSGGRIPDPTSARAGAAESAGTSTEDTATDVPDSDGTPDSGSSTASSVPPGSDADTPVFSGTTDAGAPDSDGTDTGTSDSDGTSASGDASTENTRGQR